MLQENFVPKWLNESLFKDILQDNILGYDQIISYSAKEAFNGCGVFSINIKVQLKDRKTNTISYVLKLPPTSEEAKEIIFSAFKREKTTYHELLPTFRKIFNDAGNEIQFAPNSFTLNKNIAVDAVLFEDLKPKGYKNVNSLEGLNMVHAKAVLDKLAAFHAASAVYRERDGHLLKTYTDSPTTPKQQAYYKTKNIASNRKFIECLRKHDLREYQDKMKMYQQNFTELYMKAEKADPSEFNVLTHGDFWSNNIMFKYDAFGNIVDTVFLNFQNNRYGTPVRDLVCFILTSIRLEEKLKYFDSFIKYYHDQLISNLKLLLYPKKLPKLTDLHVSILRNSCFAFMAVSKSLPFALLESTNEFNVDMNHTTWFNTDDRNMLNLMFENPRYGEHIKEIITWMEDRGLLED